ncbi:uncharacterized protein LOC108631312 isoform X2 [Ceratina calcarata]|uniref:Uncharacterized protein LOC108631312 isoform X2 n=1 Tax=Ceratina calcarata TaxID=156304 RepID=A0AAJ7WG19_9HYME|nr:uncharacterized protein LOC108631312 isoform X2 [Ceratina calcarata]
MNPRMCAVLISFWLHLLVYWVRGHPTSKGFGFLPYRTTSTVQKYCNCITSYSCSCCQSVVILYTKAEKNLCVNFNYQRTGFDVNVTLNSDTLRARAVIEYKPFKFCTNIPGCYFSSACVNVLELNKFPRSITACLRLDVFSKKRLWQLNYDCVSVSTELPTMSGNGTMPTTKRTEGMGGTSTTMKAGMTSRMTTTQMTMTTLMPRATAETEETTSSDVEVITVPGTATGVDID